MTAFPSSRSPEAATATTIAEPADQTAGAVGTARPRIEGRAKVTGTARYAADASIQDLAFGSVVASTVSRGRIREIDTSAAEGGSGVLGVIDHGTAPRLNPRAGHFFGPDGGILLLQNDVVPYAGWPLALVSPRHQSRHRRRPKPSRSRTTSSLTTASSLPTTRRPAPR